MRRDVHIVLVLVLAASSGCGARPPQAARSGGREALGYSGLVRLADDDAGAVYLTVHDRKDDPRHDRYAWLGLLVWRPGQPARWRPLPLVPPPGAEPPNDLEACCRVPGDGTRVLLAESGYRETEAGRPLYGRFIVLSLEPAAGDPTAWVARWEHSFRPLPYRPPSVPRRKGDDIEAIACLDTGGGRHVLLFATLGGPDVPSVLRWGPFDRTAPVPFRLAGTAPLTSGAGPLGERACGALWIEPVGVASEYEVWSVAASDPGETKASLGAADGGPFCSAVYRAGTLRRSADASTLSYRPTDVVEVAWEVAGLKVEALAEAPSAMPEARLVYGTDDEDHGGVWRPLPPRPVR